MRSETNDSILRLNSKLARLTKIISEIFFNMHGAMLPKHREIPEELNDVYEYVYKSDYFTNRHTDILNLKNDVNNLKRDCAKAYNDYKLEKVSEQT